MNLGGGRISFSRAGGPPSHGSAIMGGGFLGQRGGSGAKFIAEAVGGVLCFRGGGGGPSHSSAVTGEDLSRGGSGFQSITDVIGNAYAPMANK